MNVQRGQYGYFKVSSLQLLNGFYSESTLKSSEKIFVHMDEHYNKSDFTDFIRIAHCTINWYPCHKR